MFAVLELDRTDVSERQSHNEVNRDFAAQLRTDTAAVRLRVRWPGNRKTLTTDQKRRAAGTFDADSRSVSASKKLLDTAHPAMRAASAVRSQATEHFRRSTLPYVEPGVRLLRREDVPTFEVVMTTLRSELADAVEQVSRHRDELIDSAQLRLGGLFDPADYAGDLASSFGLAWDYPNVDPPPYLYRLSRQLYEAEASRVRHRFDEAVRLAEEAFAEELAGLVSHLAERLSGEDGERRIFRDSAVTNLTEFFERFAQLNIRSDAQLDELVERARSVVVGSEAQQLRDNDRLRTVVREGLTDVERSLDDYLTTRPRRSVMRPR